jgi:hypothetical protein
MSPIVIIEIILNKILKYDWNCLILLQDLLNIVKPEIVKEILKMCKLLEVEDFLAQSS